MPPGRRLAKWSLRLLGLLAAGCALIVLGFAITTRATHPKLSAWHRLRLHEEFHADRADIKSFEDYRRLEDRLFAELRTRLLDNPQATDSFALGRYHPGSVPEQLALDTRYNRSYELVPANPRGSVLLVHGLSDSPYSLRAIAQTFYSQGYDVVVLRLPGHGTIPAGLLDVDWRDWYSAVTLAAKYAAARAGPGRPFLAGGHSTGAALLTLYSVRALEDTTLPRPQRLYLTSPAIGLSDFAALSNIVSALSFLPFFEQSAWADVVPEYDPYKYNSFPVNAGKQIYRLTRQLQRELESAGDRGRLGDMPRVTVFQSIVDATVKTTDIVQGFLALLPPRGHELVVFDVNRIDILQGLIAQAPIESLQRIRDARDLPFRVTLIANRAPGSREVAAYVREAGGQELTVRPLSLEWPPGVVSLGHVAIPFPIDDPVYGLTPGPGEGPVYPLGSFAARGEPGALVVPLDKLARLRCNPFFDVIRAKIVESLPPD